MKEYDREGHHPFIFSSKENIKFKSLSIVNFK